MWLLDPGAAVTGMDRKGWRPREGEGKGFQKDKDPQMLENGLWLGPKSLSLTQGSGFDPASAVSPALQVDSLLAEPSEKPLSFFNGTHKCI